MIKCRLINPNEEKKKNPNFKLSPGDMFYKENEAGKQLFVILPNRAHFNLTNAKTIWDKVEGEPPKITVEPSIQYINESGLYEAWHGFLYDGVFTDA